MCARAGRTRKRLKSPENVYLLRQKATGKAAASNPLNQTHFQWLMGLVDEPLDDVDLPCPLAEDDINMLADANSHVYVKGVHQRGVADGLFTDKELAEKPTVLQNMCTCLAHERIEDPQFPDTLKFHLGNLMRTPRVLSGGTGTNFGVSFLSLLLHMMDLPAYVVTQSGQLDGVSYVLLGEGRHLNFRGQPDFVLFQNDVGAGQILVASGEVQSTRQPQVQNGIYAVGHLLNNLHLDVQKVICITIFKNKSLSLAVARLQPPEEGEDLPAGEVVGKVSFKSFISPSALGLIHADGLKEASARLFYLLKNVD